MPTLRYAGSGMSCNGFTSGQRMWVWQIIAFQLPNSSDTIVLPLPVLPIRIYFNMMSRRSCSTSILLVWPGFQTICAKRRMQR